MAFERTFSIIKPDATRRNLTGQINARFEAAGLRIVAQHPSCTPGAVSTAILARAAAVRCNFVIFDAHRETHF